MQDNDHRRERVAEDLHRFSIKLTEGENSGKSKCTLCGKISKSRTSSLIHVEAIHFPGTYMHACMQCGEKFDTVSKCATHRSKMHTRNK